MLYVLLQTRFDEHSGSALPLISALTIAVALTAACTAHYYQATLARLAGRRHWLNAFVESVVAILHRGSARRADDRLLATGLHLLSLAALLLPGDSRADTLATARDVLFEATGAAPTRRAISAVVLRLLGGMLTEAVRARKRLLGGAGGGIATALTITSSVQTLLGLHLSFPVGAVFAVASTVLGAVVGGWVAGIGERRVP